MTSSMPSVRRRPRIGLRKKPLPSGPVIHLYVHGRGRGHTTRCLAIARALEASGRAFHAFVGRDGVSLFSATYPCTEVESLPPTPGAAAMGVAKRVRAAIDAARKDRVSAILSDGDLPGLLAAKALRKPSVAVGHGLVFSECKRPASLPRAPWLREAAKAAASSVGAHRCIAVNFVPLEPRSRRVTVARPSLDPRLHRISAPDEVLCYFRDGAPEVLRMLVELGVRPVVFATRNPGVSGIEYEPQSRGRFIERMARARVVVASAGSQLISECVSLGIPMLALHRRDDDEQRLNAAMLKMARLGDGCSFDALTGRRLERFVRSPPLPPEASFGAPDVAEAALAALEG